MEENKTERIKKNNNKNKKNSKKNQLDTHGP
jgi:hypothetical protein